MNDRECPYPGCPVTDLPPSRFACRDHWYTLPTKLRVAISAGWRLLSRGGSFQPLDEAQGAAVHYWQTGELLPLQPVHEPRPTITPTPRRKGRR